MIGGVGQHVLHHVVQYRVHVDLRGGQVRVAIVTVAAGVSLCQTALA